MRNQRKRISLDDLEKKQIFDVPEAYFDQLPGKISSRVQTPTSEIRFGFSLWIRYSAGLAAIVLVVLAGFWFFPSTPSDPVGVVSDLPEKEIIEYLHLHADFSSSEWMETASRVTFPEQDNLLREMEINEDSLLDELDPVDFEETL